MIFNRNLVATVALLLSVSLQAHAHAAISPVLGVNGTPKRSDVQRPSDAKPCGNANIAQTLDSSKAVQLKADNTFSTTIQNFNAGVDGSLQVDKVLVDATGTGKKFVAAQMNPPTVTSAAISVKLPGGTTCQGGKDKDLCLVSFKTAGGFGNCVVVQQPKAAGAKAKVTAKANASANGGQASSTTEVAITSAAASSTDLAASLATTTVDTPTSTDAACATETVTVTVTLGQSASATVSIPLEATTAVLKRAVRRAEFKNRMNA
ncbi:hypothetical protein K466DRAFT_594484 [Polyporus arcularius HHB13444]|uniref:Uncharacterized protein n=1 Tax=Polyporus arcularius HHB13444 TaxID=1314778 RepID=A0A5C3PU82_9APHY|nr:hypothetical protein K466DRAFT_594484 [Polyporus arcularius HHB13444]